jgi:PAS domain S-box-containing protein
MNWVQYTWMLISGMCLALGLVQLLVWLRRRSELPYLVYAIFAIGAACGALGELNQLFSRNAAEFAHALRLTHIGMGLSLLCMPWFVRVRFGAGRDWLLWSATGLRLLVVVVSVVSAMTINLADLQVRQYVLPGDVAVAMPVGHFNPWVIPAHLNLLLLLAFFADAVLELRQRGDRDEYLRGVRVCGGLSAFILVSGGQSALVAYGYLQMPFLITPAMMLPILLLSYELGADLLNSRLARARLWQSELLLRESEERWELVGEAVGIAPWSWYAHSNELHMGAKARELFGLERDNRIDLARWHALIHPEDAERIQRDVAQSMLEGSGFERDYRIVLANGTVRWITSRGRIERDQAGVVASMHGVSLDITRMRQADEMLRAALESAPNAMFLVDEEGRILLANARASLIFGFNKDELLDKPLAELVPDWRSPPERRRRASEPPGSGERRVPARELSGRRRDGQVVPVEVALSPVEGGLLLASVNDIAERRAAERENAQQRTELAHLSRVAVLGEMSASLAHELNQPLTAIVSNAQAASRFLDMGPEYRQDLRDSLLDIAASGNRAGDVIRRLRAMLKKEEMQRAPLDVNQLIHEVLQLYRTDLVNRGVVVRPELDHGLPAVIGDRVQLQQVLLNLVINACDAMANLAGERRLCICSRRLAGDEVEFAVCDIGPGIAPERLEQVFEPFVTSKASGMGLGLSVCKTIVKSHGGRIWANNNAQGPGASFHVALTAMADQRVPHIAAELDRT